MQTHLCHLLQILGYTLVGIIHPLVILYVVESSIIQPFLKIHISYPFAPPHLQSLVKPRPQSLGSNAADSNEKRLQHQFPNKVKILVGEGIEKILVPIGEPRTYSNNGHVQKKDKKEQSPGHPFLLGHPPRLYQLPAVANLGLG